MNTARKNTKELFDGTLEHVTSAHDDIWNAIRSLDQTAGEAILANGLTNSGNLVEFLTNLRGDLMTAADQVEHVGMEMTCYLECDEDVITSP